MVSGALVVAALSSTVVQLQPATVLVAAADPGAAGVPASAPARAPAARPAPAGQVAAPARPAYVTAARGQQHLALQPTSGAATVDVLACSTAWSTTGQCPGVQADVVRQVALSGATTALALPAGVPHLRVSVAGGAVAVGAAS